MNRQEHFKLLAIGLLIIAGGILFTRYVIRLMILGMDAFRDRPGNGTPVALQA